MTKFLLLTYHDPAGRPCTTAAIRANLAYHRSLEDSLASSGELVEAVHVTGPDQARFVASAALPPDRPLLGEYRIVDVADEGRALEIAQLLSGAPGPGGPRPVEVRPLMVPEPLRES
jgi:hypothetical protein